jgi:serine/threonine-protein kinase
LKNLRLLEMMPSSDRNTVPMSRSRWSVDEGDIIDGRFAVVREIGRGGMGAVYEAFDRKLERSVALKFLDPGLIEEGDAVSRFQREALAAGRIGHESICDVRDRGETEEGVPYIVMELLDGRALSWSMRDGQRIDPGRLGRLILQVLSALEAAHRAGIVHRDLKPENLFVTRSIEGLERIKILDFGISRFLSETIGSRLTRTGTVMGSPLYMSPEQAAGSKDIDHRADIWSVGVIMYEALTGTPPFDGDNYNQIMISIVTTDPAWPRLRVPEIPEPIERVVLKAMTKDRDERYGTAAEFADALRAALEASGEDPSLLAGAQTASAPHAVKQPDPKRSTPVNSESRVDAVAVTVPERLPGSRRPVPRKATAALAGLSIGVTIVALAIYGALHGTDSGSRPVPAPAETTVQPAKAPVETARSASVELRGLPEGARVTFDGEPVQGTRLEGPTGRRGLLEIAGEGLETVRVDVTIRDGGVVDLTDRFQPSLTVEAPADVTPAPGPRSGDQRDERGPRHGGRDGSKAPSAIETPIKGRHGSPVFTDYPGTD